MKIFKTKIFRKEVPFYILKLANVTNNYFKYSKSSYVTSLYVYTIRPYQINCPFPEIFRKVIMEVKVWFFGGILFLFLITVFLPCSYHKKMTQCTINLFCSRKPHHLITICFLTNGWLIKHKSISTLAIQPGLIIKRL